MNRRVIKLSAAFLVIAMIMMMALKPKAEAAQSIQASAMALIDFGSGSVLAEENSDVRLPMASTTKIMTALVVLENCDPDEEFMMPEEAIGVEGSSIYLRSGEVLSVRDLLYGLMLASGNDAAVALAVHVGGTAESFVDMMNWRAEEMGLSKTHFITPNGLHSDKHLTTAYELCMMTREALGNELFKEIVSTKYYTTQSGDYKRTFKNKNSLLWDYEGAFGVKTGYTMAAGRCLVFGAERDGMTLVGAVLNCRPMFETAAKLMDEAFESHCSVTVIPGGTPVMKTLIEKNYRDVLEVETKGSIITMMRKSDENSFRLVPELYEGLEAPIDRGAAVGLLTAYDGDREIGSTELVASNDVPILDLYYWWRVLVRSFAS